MLCSVVMPEEQAPPGNPTMDRRVIHVTCRTCGGPRGFTNLVAARLDGVIELDPHATGQCVLMLDQQAATQLRDSLSKWLS